MLRIPKKYLPSWAISFARRSVGSTVEFACALPSGVDAVVWGSMLALGSFGALRVVELFVDVDLFLVAGSGGVEGRLVSGFLLGVLVFSLLVMRARAIL